MPDQCAFSNAVSVHLFTDYQFDRSWYLAMAFLFVYIWQKK